MLTKKELADIKRMAEDAIKAVEAHGNVEISTLNYGLRPSKEVLTKLAKVSGLEVIGFGFLGYVQFFKKENV